jgi:hypothetical protein
MFLASFPVLLTPLAPAGGTIWCLDRPRLGSEFVPDFLLATITSVGFRWTLIELESPPERPLTRAGLPANKLADALRQVRDRRTWLTDNVAYARAELGLKDIDSACTAFIVIGRRAGLDPKQIKTYRALSLEEGSSGECCNQSIQQSMCGCSGRNWDVFSVGIYSTATAADSGH